MVMEIPETVICTRQVNEDELQVFNKVSEYLSLKLEYFEKIQAKFPFCQVYLNLQKRIFSWCSVI